MSEELQRRRWKDADLDRVPERAAERLAIATRLRAETTRSVEWIARRLRMGSRGYVNQLLHRARKAGSKMPK